MREAAGFRMGPFELLDLTGLDVSLPVLRQIYDQFYQEARYRPGFQLEARVAAGLYGRKSGEGFFRYAEGEQEVSADALALRLVLSSDEFKENDIAERLSLLMVNEGFRVLGEGVAESGDDVDFAMILGTGFAPFRGGPMNWANSLGFTAVREKLTRLSEVEGDAFKPANLLSSAANGHRDRQKSFS